MSAHPPFGQLARTALVRIGVMTGLSVMIVLLGCTAAARGATVRAPATAATAPGTSTPVMIILDASGSMNITDAPGPRITAAKKAVDDLVDSLPEGATVGLLVYGTGTDSSGGAKAAGCRDIKPVVALGKVDKASFKSAVAGIAARGYTPIGNALSAAAARLPKEGPRSIVLVSDGEDTCAPPAPCDVARKLSAAGTDLTVHTVGFKVNNAARSELTCIAAATGGSYRETSQGADLGRILVNRVGVALRPYNAVGTPITGSSSPVGAPELKPGQYVDTFFSDDATNPRRTNVKKYFTVSLRAGETLHASITLAMPPVVVPSASLVSTRIELLTPDGGTCSTAEDTKFAEDNKIGPATTVLSVAPGGQSVATSYCDQKQGQFVLAIRRAGTALATQGVRAEIDVRIEPAADASHVPAPEYKALPAISPATDATPRVIDGGSSFDNAPLLVPGTYRDLVVSGETRYYRVHVAYGQRLNYRIGLPAIQSNRAKNSVDTRTSITTPIRQQASSSGDALGFYYGDGPVIMHASADFDARYTNRASANVTARPFGIDGDYYVVFSSSLSNATQFQLPLIVTVAVDGSIEPGPIYGRSGPLIPTATPSAPATSSPQSSSAAGVSARGSVNSGLPVWIWATSAAVVVLAVGAALMLARRRRAQSDAQAATRSAEGTGSATHPHGW